MVEEVKGKRQKKKENLPRCLSSSVEPERKTFDWRGNIPRATRSIKVRFRNTLTRPLGPQRLQSSLNSAWRSKYILLTDYRVEEDKPHLKYQEFNKRYDHVPRERIFKKACAAVLHAQGSDVCIQPKNKYSGIRHIYTHNNCETKLSDFMFTLAVLVADMQITEKMVS